MGEVQDTRIPMCMQSVRKCKKVHRSVQKCIMRNLRFLIKKNIWIPFQACFFTIVSVTGYSWMSQSINIVLVRLSYFMWYLWLCILWLLSWIKFRPHNTIIIIIMSNFLRHFSWRIVFVIITSPVIVRHWNTIFI